MQSSTKSFFEFCVFLALSAQVLSFSQPFDYSLLSGASLSEQPGLHHVLRARQVDGGKKPLADGQGKGPQATPQAGIGNGSGPQAGKGGKEGEGGSPGEEAAGQLVGMLLQLGEALDAVTNMGSNTTVIKAGCDAVIKMLPEMTKARTALLEAAPKNEELNKLVTKANTAGEQIVQLLKTIQGGIEDANIVKKAYNTLGDAFGDVFRAAEAIVNAAFPGAAGGNNNGNNGGPQEKPPTNNVPQEKGQNSGLPQQLNDSGDDKTKNKNKEKGGK